MKIKCSNPAVRSIGRDGQTVTLNDKGEGTTTKELAKRLAREMPDTIKILSGGESPEDDDATEEVTEDAE